MNPKIAKKLVGSSILGALVIGGVGLTASQSFAQSLPQQFLTPALPTPSVGYGQIQSVSVTNNNQSTISQGTSINVSTGGNTANHNVGPVSIHSGNVSVQSTQAAQTNTNVTNVNLSAQATSSATITSTGH